MNPFLLGGMVGGAIAVLSFLSSTGFSSKMLRGPKLLSIALVLGGFILRLMILSLLFYGLSKLKWIHFQTTLVVFALGFTLCLAFKAMQVCRELRSFQRKPTGR